MSKFISPRFDSLEEYVPGEQPRDKKYIKLNTNESPFPPSPAVLRAGSDQIALCNLYSDPTLRDLRTKIAELYGVEMQNVIATNGSDEALSFAFMAYCDKSTGVAYPDISYGFYKVFAQLYGLDCLEIPLRDDFTINVSDYFGLGRTIFIANPNAPTGIALTPDEIEQIVINNPDNVVIIDEAYVDFGAQSCVPLTKKYKNLLVVQTFSKSRSLAGARIGFAIGDVSLISDLEKLRYSTNPYNVNRMSAACGCAALDENSYYTDNCKKIIKSRELMVKGLTELGFITTKSSANFVFARHTSISGDNIYSKLRENGILVRHFSSPKICEYNRITVGSEEQTKALLNALKIIVKEISK